MADEMTREWFDQIVAELLGGDMAFALAMGYTPETAAVVIDRALLNEWAAAPTVAVPSWPARGCTWTAWQDTGGNVWLLPSRPGLAQHSRALLRAAAGLVSLPPAAGVLVLVRLAQLPPASWLLSSLRHLMRPE